MKFMYIMVVFLLSVFNAIGSDNLSKEEVKNSIESYLNSQINNKELSAKLSNAIIEGTLYWTPPNIDINKGSYILAYSFGNGIAKNGNKLPGDMNRQLADLVVKIYDIIKKPVYAQWEIAYSIGDRIPKNNVHAIFPEVTNEGDVIYLSTVGVAEDFVKQVGKDNIRGKKVIVIGFRDHIPRCVSTSRNAGLDAYAPKGYEMPDKYDVESGQPWTRSREKYMIYDMSVRLKQTMNNIKR